MRRRPVAGVLPDQMEKTTSKNQNSRICFLASLSAFFWFLLLYFHFVVLASDDQSTTTTDFNQLPTVNFEPQQQQSLTRKSIGFPDVELPQQQQQQETPQKQNFPFMRALRTADNKSDPCGGRYIYVHDLPSRFNEDMLKECKTLSLWTNMCKFTTNAGLGPPLENVDGVFSDTGWYATNQFAVDVIFSNRMKQYECLTHDSSIAAAIFVPFYAGFDIASDETPARHNLFYRGLIYKCNLVGKPIAIATLHALCALLDVGLIRTTIGNHDFGAQQHNYEWNNLVSGFTFILVVVFRMEQLDWSSSRSLAKSLGAVT